MQHFRVNFGVIWRSELGFLSVLFFLLEKSGLTSTALHGMQTRYRDEKAVRLSVCVSVCLSVKRVNCDKTEERSVHIFIPYERSVSLVF